MEKHLYHLAFYTNCSGLISLVAGEYYLGNKTGAVKFAKHCKSEINKLHTKLPVHYNIFDIDAQEYIHRSIYC